MDSQSLRKEKTYSWSCNMTKVKLEDGYYRTVYSDGEEIVQYIKDNKNDVGDSLDREIEHFGAVYHRVYVIDEAEKQKRSTLLGLLKRQLDSNAVEQAKFTVDILLKE